MANQKQVMELSPECFTPKGFNPKGFMDIYYEPSKILPDKFLLYIIKYTTDINIFIFIIRCFVEDRDVNPHKIFENGSNLSFYIRTVEQLKALIALYNIDLCVRDNKNRNAAHVALKYNRREVAEYILELRPELYFQKDINGFDVQEYMRYYR